MNARRATTTHMPAARPRARRARRRRDRVSTSRGVSRGGSSISRPTSSAGAVERRIERERARPPRASRAAAARDVVAGANAVRARSRCSRASCAAQREVAIAVEVALDAFAELARGRDRSSRSFAVAATHSASSSGGDVALGARVRRPRVDAGRARSRARAAARVQRLAGEDLEQDAAERVDVGAAVDLGAPRTCSGAM